MPSPGDNLPGFRARQLEFAAHIRNPDVHAPPADVEPRRMQIYLDLFYNNIESLLSSAFPVARQILDSDGRWHPLVRAFLHRHPAESPYFLEISQEFLTFLAEGGEPDLPPYLVELCHYEWVELALSVAEEEIPQQGIDRFGDLATGVPVVSPLIWKLGYHYPVHRIGVDHQPMAPAERPTYIVVYRRRDDCVRFMEVSALTMALLDGLDGQRTGSEVLAALAAEHDAPRRDSVYENGLATLERLRNAEILLGIRTVTETTGD